MEHQSLERREAPVQQMASADREAATVCTVPGNCTLVAIASIRLGEWNMVLIRQEPVGNSTSGALGSQHS